MMNLRLICHDLGLQYEAHHECLIVGKLVDAVIEGIYVPCTIDPQLAPASFGIAVTILSQALDMPLKDAAMLLMAHLELRSAKESHHEPGP